MSSTATAEEADSRQAASAAASSDGDADLPISYSHREGSVSNASSVEPVEISGDDAVAHTADQEAIQQTAAPLAEPPQSDAFSVSNAQEAIGNIGSTEQADGVDFIHLNHLTCISQVWPYLQCFWPPSSWQ